MHGLRQRWRGGRDRRDYAAVLQSLSLASHPSDKTGPLVEVAAAASRSCAVCIEGSFSDSVLNRPEDESTPIQVWDPR